MGLLQEQCCCEYIPYNTHNLSMMLTQRTGWPEGKPFTPSFTPPFYRSVLGNINITPISAYLLAYRYYDNCQVFQLACKLKTSVAN